MIYVSIISFLVFAGVLLESRFRNTDLFSPARLYLLFHSAALGVAFLALDKAMTPWRPFTSFIYFGGAACFLAGTWVVGMFGGFSDRFKSTDPRPDLSSYGWRRHYLFAVPVLLVFLFGAINAAYGGGGIPLLSEYPPKVLKAFYLQPWYFIYPFTFGGLAAILLIMPAFRRRGGRFAWLREPGLWLAFFTILIFSLFLSRTAVIFTVFFAVLFYHYALRHLSLAKLVQIFLVCFLLVLVTGYAKGRQITKTASVDMGQVLVLAMKLPYMYIANNFWNLDHVLNPPETREIQPTTYGYATGQGVLSALYFPGGTLAAQMIKDTKIDDQFNKRSSKVRGWNTIPYHWPLYKDFGIFGVFIGSFLIGFGMALLYLGMRRRPTMLKLGMYCYFAYWIANSYFSSIAEAPNYVVGAAYLFVCLYACTHVSRIWPMPERHPV